MPKTQTFFWDFPAGSDIQNLPAKKETQVQFLDWEDPLEKGMATHSSILVWRVPWANTAAHGVAESDMTE